MIQNVLRKQPRSFSRQRSGIFYTGWVSYLISVWLSMHSACLRQNLRQKDLQTNIWGQLQSKPGKASQSSWIPGFRQSLHAKDSKESIKNEHFIFRIILICPITLGPLKLEDYVWHFFAIPKPFLQFWCKHPEVKAECLHFNFMLIISFQIHRVVVQGQNYENCVTVQIFPDPTVWSGEADLSKKITVVQQLAIVMHCIEKKKQFIKL